MKLYHPDEVSLSEAKKELLGTGTLLEAFGQLIKVALDAAEVIDPDMPTAAYATILFRVLAEHNIHAGHTAELLAFFADLHATLWAGQCVTSAVKFYEGAKTSPN